MLQTKNTFGIFDKSYKLIIASFQKYPEIEKAIIFGSRALGNYKRGSDIDVALIGNNISLKIISAISAKLNEELPIPYHIDVINFNSTHNEELKNHILTHGKVFYKIDKSHSVSIK